MPARILDGTKIANDIRREVAAEVQTMVAAGVRPGLAVVLVGHGGRAAGVGADEVAGDGGAGSPAVGHQDAVGAVARDDVILGVGAGARVADGVVDGAQADVDAVAVRVAQAERQYPGSTPQHPPRSTRAAPELGIS